MIPIASDESHIDVQLAETDDNEASSPLQRATEDQGDLDDSDEDDFTLDAMPWDDPGVPILLPRRRFAGAGNVETVKDGRCRTIQPALVVNLFLPFSKLSRS